MTIPGFTAEQSAYKSNQQYTINMHLTFRTEAQFISPQSICAECIDYIMQAADNFFDGISDAFRVCGPLCP